MPPHRPCEPCLTAQPHRLPSTAVLEAATAQGGLTATLQGSATGSGGSRRADIPLLQGVLSDIVLVNDLKTIPCGPSRRAQVALQVMLHLEIERLGPEGTSSRLVIAFASSMQRSSSLLRALVLSANPKSSFRDVQKDNSRLRGRGKFFSKMKSDTWLLLHGAGGDFERKHKEISVYEGAFGLLLIELNAFTAANPDRWFFKRVLRPRYGMEVPRIASRLNS